MGNEILKNSTLLMVNEDGTSVELEGIVHLEPVENCELNNSENCYIQNASLEFTGKIKSMTRKKFIKLLMAKGIQRNGANEIAKYVNKKHNNYNAIDLIMW